MIDRKAALQYHDRFPRGKTAVVPTKSCATQQDLSYAYTPGVADPCRETVDNPDAGFQYTARGNLVGVITDGSAVLGLGDIGPLAAKPVMEGKSVLFRRFAGISAFDLEIDADDAEAFIGHVKALEPTFGGINLEDIASPHCFEIESALKQALSIPVFHDDQHGTAVIVGAAMFNAAEITGRDPAEMDIVVCGAGAAGRAVHRHLVDCGADAERILCCDEHGVLHIGREERISSWHDDMFRQTEKRTLAELFVDADMFIGVSAGGIVTEAMIDSMAPDPVVFAMANPDPEISWDAVKRVRPDAIAGTGRSDFPNQVNNVLAFPAIFRGALDVRSSAITTGMKIAASRALADIARRPVTEQVFHAYGISELSFSKEYVIPRPFDSRVLIEVASAVARQAVDEGVAGTDYNHKGYVSDLNILAASLERQYG